MNKLSFCSFYLFIFWSSFSPVNLLWPVCLACWAHLTSMSSHWMGELAQCGLGLGKLTLRSASSPGDWELHAVGWARIAHRTYWVDIALAELALRVRQASLALGTHRVRVSSVPPQEAPWGRVDSLRPWEPAWPRRARPHLREIPRLAFWGGVASLCLVELANPGWAHLSPSPRSSLQVGSSGELKGPAIRVCAWEGVWSRWKDKEVVLIIIIKFKKQNGLKS